jgi:signal transduction histidine kinase
MTLGIAKQFYQYKKEKEEMLIEYLNQQKEINRKILDVQEIERKRISKELHDDIGAGLTQIILIGNAAQKKYTKTEELQNIGETAQQLVSSMGEIIWSMTPGNNRAEDFFSYTREQLNKQLEYSGMEYSIDFPENVVEVEMTNEMRRNLLMVTKEIINNAIKYSNAQEIKIKAELLKRKLCIEIKDNGVGFDSSAASSGNGLKNIKKRVDEMGGELIIESSEEKGTHFTVNVTIL